MVKKLKRKIRKYQVCMYEYGRHDLFIVIYVLSLILQINDDVFNAKNFICVIVHCFGL